MRIDYFSIEPSQGYDNILVITDHFSKFAQAIPAWNQMALTSAKTLFYVLFARYGIPDEGDPLSVNLSSLCTKKSWTSPYYPSGNNFAETLLDILGTRPVERKSKWKDHIRAVVNAYNCSIHETSGVSPYLAMFDREPRLPVDVQSCTT